MKTNLKILKQEHPETLTSMAYLTIIYLNQERWKEAEELGVRVMEMSKRIQRQEHPHMLITMANLAGMYRKQRRWKEAEKLEVHVMEAEINVLKAEDPYTLLRSNRFREGAQLLMIVSDT